MHFPIYSRAIFNADLIGLVVIHIIDSVNPISKGERAAGKRGYKTKNKNGSLWVIF